MAGINHQPFVIRVIDQGFQQLFPNAFIPPANKTAMRVAPTFDTACGYPKVKGGRLGIEELNAPSLRRF